MEVAPSTRSEEVETINSSPALQLPAPAEVVVAPETPAEAPATAKPAELADVPARPVQANRNRCFGCNKKVGLLGFECRCSYVFCSAHRHAADHACTFDYAAMDKARLVSQNPVVAASKLDNRL